MSFWEPPALEMFRASPARDGFYPSRGVQRLNGLKWKFRTRGWVISSPVVVPGLMRAVCVGSWDGHLYIIDSEQGTSRASFATAAPIVSSPAVDSGAVLFGSYDNCLYAVHLTTGSEIWRFPTRNSIASSPLITRQFFPAGVLAPFPIVRSLYVAFAGIDGCLYVLDLNGRPRAVFDTGHPVVSSPAGPVSSRAEALSPESADPAVICIGSMDGTAYGVDIKSGKKIWQYRTRGPVDSTPATAHGAFFVGSADGSVYALDAASGLERWQFAAGGPVRSSPAVRGGTVYFGSDDGRLYAVAAKDGKLLWEFETKGPLASSPSLGQKSVYVGSDDGNVYAVDADSGHQRWHFPTEGPVRSSPAVADGVVYVGSNDGCVYALE